MSQRLRALMLGIASALNDGPPAKSSVWPDLNIGFGIQVASKKFFSRIANIGAPGIAPCHGTMLQRSIK
jgi:hypothetical protein